MSMQTSIDPVEEFILKGIATRINQVFSCRSVYSTSTDKPLALKRLFEGSDVEYPFAYLSAPNITPNTESYNPHSLGRRGLPVSVNEGSVVTVRLLPANFEIEIEYNTDKYEGFANGSVLAFLRRYMFARRFGYLKFNINYGKLNFYVSSTLSDTPTVTPRESTMDSEPAYKVTSSIVVHGYVSEPMTGTQGVITEFDVQTMLGEGAQYFSFE